MKKNCSNPTVTTPSVFAECQTAHDVFATQADIECQKVWDNLHANHSKIVDMDLALREVHRACSEIKKRANVTARRIEDHYQEEARLARVKPYKI